ncbi:hypothetical protein C2S51_007606 [Perilla frutescens var. frutescens]|nr:hypothetical protein C2S51_007606 [Perilla frutescens var. frutescens]
MAFRGRGRGRGRGGFGGGGGGYRSGKQEPVELFPEIECLGTVKYSDEEVRKYARFVNWSKNLQTFFETSSYYYEGRSQHLNKVQKLDIERYADKKLRATQAKQPLWHLIKMDTDHMPAELARGDKRVAKKVRWDNDVDLNKLDVFEKLEQKHEGKEGGEKKENEEEEEEELENEEDDGEYSDEGDYEQAEYCDDDEDDFNMAEEVDEPDY